MDQKPLTKFIVTYKDEIWAHSEEEAYQILLDYLSAYVKYEIVTLFEFTETTEQIK